MAIKQVGFLLGNGLMVSEGVFWKHHRKMIQPAFRRDLIGLLTSTIVAVNTALLVRWERAAREKTSVNVTRDVSVTILKIVLIWMFGDDYERVAQDFRILCDEPTRDLHLVQTFRLLGKLVADVAGERRRRSSATTDMLRLLMEARNPESGRTMPERQLISEVLTLVVAGHETTASTLNMIWHLLSQNPHAEAKLWRELEGVRKDAFSRLADLPGFPYTRQIIDEVLRLYPPGWLMTRRALKDDQLDEYFVPAGTEIYIPPYFVQRNPALWESPDRFDPDRFDPRKSQGRDPLAMFPFSAGPRNCIGEMLARVEMQIHLMTIASGLRLRYEGAQPEFEARVNLRTSRDLLMTPEIRVSADVGRFAFATLESLPSDGLSGCAIGQVPS